MCKKEIDTILARLRRILCSPKLQPEQIDAVNKSIKEFVQIRQSGKLDRRKVFRATARVSTVLLELCDEDMETTSSTTHKE